MAGGRRPTPTYLRVLKGNPGRRPLPKNEIRPERSPKVPAAPDWLDDYGQAEWERVAPGLWNAGLLTEADVGHACRRTASAMRNYERRPRS